MILAVLFANSKGNILVERPDSLDFFTKLPSLFAWSGLFTLFTWCLEMSASMLLCKYEYDELALAEVIFVITSAVKDVCGKLPTERLFLGKYGRICLTLDEIIWKRYLENTNKIRRLVRLKPPTEF
ncbi:TSET complex member tstD isoform X3 [Gossypium hirsutum]|uniref:Coatomer subunit zeta n=1 Tax=Gossypium hirsutum TaxID=3635 RepID=A0A1U8KZ72_GOSHI|nr:TSET complex member tstD-like isoform X3 [Gossypium hirsutum]